MSKLHMTSLSENTNNEEFDWLNDLQPINLMAIYDMTFDIFGDIELSGRDTANIPSLQLKVKFNELMPIDGPQMRDDYVSKRLRSLERLKSENIVLSYVVIPPRNGNQRWDSRINVKVDVNIFTRFYNILKSRYLLGVEESSPSSLNNDSIWPLIHPSIQQVSKVRFENHQYPDAVFSALKEVNNRVKTIYESKTGEEKDGKDLMMKAFNFSSEAPISENNPCVVAYDKGISNQSQHDMQEGYKFIFAGAMLGIRNPKAHENFDHLTREKAIHFIFLASLLMFRLD